MYRSERSAAATLRSPGRLNERGSGITRGSQTERLSGWIPRHVTWRAQLSAVQRDPSRLRNEFDRVVGSEPQ